jgi:hypothetical protein
LGPSKSAFRTGAGDLLGGLELPHTSNKKTGTAGKHATRCALLLRFQPESKQLRLRRREDAIRDIVARAILECAQRRIRAPIEMRQCARDVLQIASAQRRRKSSFAPRAFLGKTHRFVRDRTKTVSRR